MNLTRTDYTAGELTVHVEPERLRRVARALRSAGRRIALVPTMGALHAGHRELIRRARRLPGTVVAVSIFVNPLQFGPNEDIDRYPRPLDADLDTLREEGVELAFTPTAGSMYPDGARITVHPGPLGDELEGTDRAGHFAGVLTVVAKLFNVVGPDVAFFGEKDYQQLTLVRRMVRELNIDTAIVGVPTVREPDGLALSSRNAYLTAEQRAAAVALSAALAAGRHAGPGGAEAVLSAASDVLRLEDGVDVCYLELRDPDLGPAPGTGEARLLVAAKVGITRLIDNASVRLGVSE
ncbi:MAG: pantoate--beta-alanine ligase [Kutzneria sp.]|nr:pantoate--beta-alanine ligase [Kutzneria sp.]MBV9844107.1 pantoate--beta-alanine ligase [Kutzneria sp.]